MKNNKQNESCTNILSFEPIDLANWLQKNYMNEVPTHLENAEDLQKASVLMGNLANIYSYIMSMLVYAKLDVRKKKTLKEDKVEINKAIDRKDILDNFAAIIKMQYTAISRMITVKKQVDDEIKMI